MMGISRLIVILIYTTSLCYGQFWSSIPGINYVWSDYEICNEYWIPGNMTAFREKLKKNVFGQPIVEDLVANAFGGHLKGRTKKALTVSFHGWPGSGKNFVTTFLADAIYRKGFESSFVKYINSRIEYPVEAEVSRYHEKRVSIGNAASIARIKKQPRCLLLYPELTKKVEDALTACPRTLFIFDEIDMMPKSLVDALYPFLDHHARIGGVDTTKAMYVFLSNRGGNDISDKYLELWKKGYIRNNLELHQFQEITRLAAFNEKGGLQHSDSINRALIDYFVPFLPLEALHVKQCIEAAFRDRSYYHTTNEMVKEILSQVAFTPKESPSSGMFATSGCKSIDTLVSTYIERENYKRRRNDL